MSHTVTPSDLPYFERKLRSRSNDLRAEIRDTLLRTDSEQYARLAGEVHDTAEEALADLLADVSLAEVTRDVAEIRDIEAALERIRSVSYGACVRCREPIDRERLEAHPTAKRCLPCQELYDRTRLTPPHPSL